MNSFCQENVHLQTASGIDFTEITAYDETVYFYSTSEWFEALPMQQ